MERKEEAGSKKNSGDTGFGAALGVVGQRAYVGQKNSLHRPRFRGTRCARQHVSQIAELPVHEAR